MCSVFVRENTRRRHVQRICPGKYAATPGVQVVVLQPTFGLVGAVSTVSFVPLGTGYVALAGGGTIPMPRAAVLADFDYTLFPGQKSSVTKLAEDLVGKGAFSGR